MINGDGVVTLDVLSELDCAIEADDLSPTEVLELICRVAVRLIPNANLVSLWLFKDNAQRIESLINFDAQADVFTSELVLSRSDYPAYFDAIVERELVVASHARVHPVTKCFTQSYFEPLNIHSLLDFILHKDFKPVGVICCESKDKQVDWTDDDIENIRMLASHISFCFDLTR